MSTVYNGTSEGFDSLCEGYIDYAKEVISRRSIPDIRDGLKPVGRRVLYGASRMKEKGLIKCGSIVGEIMKLHPHGDSAIYNAMSSMADCNGSYVLPPFVGQGNLGKAYSSEGPAGMRYPKAKLSNLSNIYFRDLEAIDLIPSEEGDGYEPPVLPVRMPMSLVNGTTGMGVSVSTVIPAFNPIEVIDLTTEYLQTGTFTKVITPDFATGGVLVADPVELQKIMETGKGKLKVRAKVEIVGKEILVKEVPYGKSVESIIRSINKANYPNISSAHDTTGIKSTTLVKITCKSKNAVEGVLMNLYKDRILQTSISSSMLFVEDEEPILTGVYGVVENWVEWRKKVLEKLFNGKLESVNTELRDLQYFIDLVSNEENRDKYVDLVLHKSKQDAKNFLFELFEDIPEETVDKFAGRSVSAFKDGGKYRTKYDALIESKDYYEGILNNIEAYIIKDLNELKAEIKMEGYGERRTLETTKDYRFSKIDESNMVDDSPCCWTLTDDCFLYKTHDRYVDVGDKTILYQKDGFANDIVWMFDCYGRILRLPGNSVTYSATGTYIPAYLGEAGIKMEYKIHYLGILEPNKRIMLVYNDGYVGFIHTNEIMPQGNKVGRILSNGVNTSVLDKLVDIYEDEEIGENRFLVVKDFGPKGKERFAVIPIEEIIEKGRRGRSKVFEGKDLNITSTWIFENPVELMSTIPQYTKFHHRLKYANQNEVRLDFSQIKEGRFVSRQIKD